MLFYTHSIECLGNPTNRVRLSETQVKKAELLFKNIKTHSLDELPPTGLVLLVVDGNFYYDSVFLVYLLDDLHSFVDNDTIHDYIKTKLGEIFN